MSNKEYSIYENMRMHNKDLSNYATKDEEAIRFRDEKDDIRPPFFRDIDRIIYSMSYTRYMDKTQVFSLNKNDHITKRMVHVQLVSKIARTIGRALCLNEDLIEAAALGHDIGHTPFGHVGESILNEISVSCDEGYFHHNIQSVHMLMDIENGGKGRNLTLQVLDAIMCHNGEFLCQNYMPKKKTKEEFLKEYQNSYQDKNFVKTLVPMTLEGCVVRLSDMIAYLGRDIDDAVRLGVFDKAKLPEEIVGVLGCTNREIINTIIMDVIKNSIGKNSINLSEKVYDAMKKLKDFNMKHIYIAANNKEKIMEYKEMFQIIFEGCFKDLEMKNKDSFIYKNFLNYKNEVYNKSSKERKVLDFIAGMTDHYLLDVYSYYKNKNIG